MQTLSQESWLQAPSYSDYGKASARNLVLIRPLLLKGKATSSGTDYCVVREHFILVKEKVECSVDWISTQPSGADGSGLWKAPLQNRQWKLPRELERVFVPFHCRRSFSRGAVGVWATVKSRQFKVRMHAKLLE